MTILKANKTIIVVLLIFIALLIVTNLETELIQNTKLKLTRLWGYTTIENNPLLKSQDSDLKSLEKTDARIDLGELLAGGPPKDGIPSVDNPKFKLIQDSDWSDDTLMIGIFHDGVAKAYPYNILNWHEIVNDHIGNLPITVTLCPLCDTNPVFIRLLDGKETTFGVSGKLYQSCLVMYDRQSDSLWSQPTGVAIAGEKTNTQLEMFPSTKTTVAAWKRLYPDSLIMTTDTGHKRDYERYPYGTYYTDENLIFPARNSNQLKDHPKAIYSYIYADTNQEFNAFPGQLLAHSHQAVKTAGKIVIADHPLADEVSWDEETETVVYKKTGQIIPSSTTFYFVLPAFFAKF